MRAHAPHSPAPTCLIHFCLIRLSKPIFSCPSLPLLLAVASFFLLWGFRTHPLPLASLSYLCLLSLPPSLPCQAASLPFN